MTQSGRVRIKPDPAEQRAARRQERVARYQHLLHALQSGVKAQQEFDRATNPDPDTHETGGKHLRTGLNASKVEHGALVALLIKRGVISEDDYWDAMLELLEREVQGYEEKLTLEFSDRTGQPTRVRLR